ncbi:MAG: hypothetical protein C0391_00905 [Anaerolinea sp.]|nr:hypothetical protein [Anaerolinea sp.]
MIKHFVRFGFLMAIISLAVISCGLPGMEEAKTMLTELPALTTQMAPSMPDIETLLPDEMKDQIKTVFPESPVRVPEGDIITLWAASATASSSYGSVDWSADQALMAPDTEGCGDKVTAWASQASNTVEWLELSYAVPIYLTRITIYETYNPGQIVNVEVIEPNGSVHSVYSAAPVDLRDTCPHQIVVSWDTPLNYPAEKVRVTVYQSVLGIGWAEIDSVEVQGIQVLNLYPGEDNSDTPDDDMPISTDASIITRSKDIITYSTSMTPEEVMQFYRDEMSRAGFTENTRLTVEFAGGFSMVFNKPGSSDTIVQASGVGGKVIVVIRHE